MRKNKMDDNWISIDFGTCNTVAAIMVGGKPRLICSQGDSRHFPTVACVLENGHIEVCNNALPYKSVKPECFIQEFKLNIHQPLNLNGADYKRIISAILRHIKSVAEIEKGDKAIDNAIITIPAIYSESDLRKDIMIESAKTAGFKKVELLSEPKAAAYHYMYISGAETTGLTLVYDLGGGTFDPALIDLNENKVYSDNGVRCGGQYFDAAIYKIIAKHFEENGKPLDKIKRWDDYEACRRLKEALSTQMVASALLSNGETYLFSRQDFNALIRERLKLTVDACDNLLAVMRKSWRDVERILLVGGSTAVPLVREMLRSHAESLSADNVNIVMNVTGIEHRSYEHNYAVALGGLAYKFPDKKQSETCANPETPEQKAKPEPGMLIVNGDKWRLREGVNRIGRNSDNDIVISDDKSMSRNHFEIEVIRDKDNIIHKVVSVSQTKGTTVSGVTIGANSFQCETILNDGDWIIAGHTEFEIKLNNN